MKQLLILSGKGGTGKTTVAGAFIQLSNAKAFADCDVDAPNLHLIISQSTNPDKKDYFGLPKAVIDTGLCTKCGKCKSNCRFNAIKVDNEYIVDSFSCEGCGVCEAICENNAISLRPAVAGNLMLYKDKKVFSTAQLKTGSGNSGKLVSEVKKQMKDNTDEVEIAIIDGSPGIGCPVIASMSGVDMVLIVTEPSVAGISDLERIVKTAKIFGVETAVCINKYDTNIQNSEEIIRFCKNEDIDFLGTIPYDPNVVKAVNVGRSIIGYKSSASHSIRNIFDNVIKLLQ